MKRLILIVMIFLLSACGSGAGLEGTYTNGMMNITFKPNNKVSGPNMLGGEQETTFEVDGDKIKFRFPASSDNIILVKKSDGTFDGGILGKFTKK